MAKKTKQDPTGQSSNRRKSTRRLQNRLLSAQRRIKREFNAIGRTRRRQAVLTNAETITIYDYDITPTEQEGLSRNIRSIIDDELQTQGDIAPVDWWWSEDVEQPYREGVLEALIAYNLLITGDIVRRRAERGLPVQQIDLTQVLQSTDYINARQNVYVTNYNNIKTLSQRTADQVIREINLGINAGRTPTEISQAITERFNVAESSAKRIADTEINRAYNDARLTANNVAAVQTGLRSGVIHISALLPTTRPHHAARHGNAYSVEQQMQWWDSGTERINCHCSTTPVLIDASGRVVQTETQESILAEREFFNVTQEPEKQPIKQKSKPRVKEEPLPISKPKSTKEVIGQIEKSSPKIPIKKIKRSREPKKTVDTKISTQDRTIKISKSRLTSDEMSYIEYYKGDGFYKHNEILRNPSAFSSEEVSYASKMQDRINSAVSKNIITEGGTLYRGIRSQDIYENAEKLIGKNIPINTAQSTASNAGASLSWAGVVRTRDGSFYTSNPGQSVILKIRAKKGQHALDMESLSIGNTGEREILLGSGGRYSVTGVKELKNPDGITTVKVLEVDYHE